MTKSVTPGQRRQPTPRELRERVGVLARGGMTDAEIGSELGLNEVRVSGIVGSLLLHNERAWAMSVYETSERPA